MIDYFLQNLWQFWALISVVCLIVELTNGDFFIMCFAIGAAITAIISAFGASLYWGIAIFAITSVLSLFFVRPVILRHLHRDEDNRVSNADAILGRIGTVSQPIECDGYGRVAIDGDDWKAESANGEPIKVGEKVKVVSRESIIIKVVKN